MLTSLHVENFRCFKNLDLADFGLINVVVGKNSAGKTALLESIFLGGGGPELPALFRTWRGVTGVIPPIQTKAAYEAFWEDLFFRFNSDLTIKVKLLGTPENTRSTKIFYDKTSRAQVISPGPKDTKPPIGFSGYSDETRRLTSDASTIVPLVFEVTDASGTPYRLTAEVSETGQLVINPASRPMGAHTLFYVATLLSSPASLASLFSDLSLRHQERNVVETFREVFPQVTDFSVLTPSGLSGLYATIPNLKEKIAIGLISAGMQKLVALLLSITTQRNGVVLIDEIEDGFYYQIFPKVWESIIAFCKEYNTQLFTSTHSAEFLRVLGSMIKKNPDDFRLLRAEEDKEGHHTVKLFKGRDFEAALEI